MVVGSSLRKTAAHPARQGTQSDGVLDLPPQAWIINQGTYGVNDLVAANDLTAFRGEVRAWLADNVPTGLPSAGTDRGFAAHIDWERTLAEAGYAAIHWPTQYGGRGAGPVEQAIFEEEYILAGGPTRVTVIGQNLMGPTLMAFGNDEQKSRWLPGILDATCVWSQGYSEPGAGSDLANVQTRGVIDGDHIVVTGQKIWTSYGHHSDWIFALVRTDPAAGKHAGISFLTIDMRSPGIEARPITQLDGHQGFAEVFFDEVRVPIDQVVGELGQGWEVAMTALQFERDAPAAAPAIYERDLGELADLVIARGLGDDPGVQDRLGELAVAVEVYKQQAARTLGRLVAGEDIGFDSSITKLLWSHLERDLYETGLELLGPYGEAAGEASLLCDEEGWRSRYWYSRAATIYAGTTEIQKGIIARRILGLPKAA